MSSSIILMVMLAAGAMTASAFVCPQGWHTSLDFRTCYKFHSNGKAWDEAQKDCQSQGGTLAVIDSLAKARDLAMIRLQTGNANPPQWIGVKRKSQISSPYSLLNGEPLDSALWSAGEPNYHRPREACAYTYQIAAKFFDAPCSNRNGYTCQKSCPEGWYDSKIGKCYKFVSTRTSWHNAQLACKKMGSRLAIIESARQQNAFSELIFATGNDKAYYWADYTEFSSKGATWCPYTFKYVTHFREDLCVNHKEYACEKDL